MIRPASFEQNPDNNNFNTSFSTKIVIGAVALAGLAGVGSLHAWNSMVRPGTIEMCGPKNETAMQATPSPWPADWNVAGRPEGLMAEIISLQGSSETGPILLQESNRRAQKVYCGFLKDRYVTSVMTDSKHYMESGGQTIMIISANKPQDIVTKIYNGPTFTGAALSVGRHLISDLVETASASPGLDHTMKGIGESRVTVAFTLKAWVDGSLQDVRYITTHNTPVESDRMNQLNENVAFIERDMKSTKLPTIVCADWNSDAKDVVPRLQKIGLQTQSTGKTSIHGRTIDFCSVSDIGFNGMKSAYASVLNKKGSDHYPIRISYRDLSIDRT